MESNEVVIPGTLREVKYSDLLTGRKVVLYAINQGSSPCLNTVINLIFKTMDNKKITITIPVEIYDSIKDQLKENNLEINSYEDFIGKKFFFRTVTYHLVGRVTKVIGHVLQLEEASWVADSGRFMNAIKEGTLREVEPVGIAFINLESCCDWFPWKHDLPTTQK